MALNDQSLIGLGNRFKVDVIPEGHSLGSWSKAEGLDVQWEVPDYRMGDQWNARLFAPASTKYSTVKLARAAEATDSQKVRDWLNKNATQWELGISVKIELEDSHKQSVMHWELRNVVVKKWAITTFDAGTGSVAIETLELDHEGFLDDEKK